MQSDGPKSPTNIIPRLTFFHWKLAIIIVIIVPIVLNWISPGPNPWVRHTFMARQKRGLLRVQHKIKPVCLSCQEIGPNDTLNNGVFLFTQQPPNTIIKAVTPPRVWGPLDNIWDIVWFALCLHLQHQSMWGWTSTRNGTIGKHV